MSFGRRVKFKPSLRQQLTTNSNYLALMAGGKLPDDLQRSLDASMPAPKRAYEKRAAPRDLEGPVVAAISSLLAVHPRVLFAVRQNTGMASYEVAGYDGDIGRYAPVHFYRKLTHGKEITITDFWGILKDGRMFACEAKRPGWSKPSTDTELAQANFLALVRNAGGVSLFATSADDVAEALA